MLPNCGTGKDSWVPWTARRSNQSILKEINPEYLLEDWCWSLSSNTLATWCEELTHWKIPWCWERLKAGGEGDDRGWDGWMASSTQWTWIWASFGSWWCTGRPDMLQSMGSRRVRHDWATELNWTEQPHLGCVKCFCLSCSYYASSCVSHVVCGCTHGIWRLWSTWLWICFPMSLIHSCISSSGLVNVQFGDLALFLDPSQSRFEIKPPMS